MKGKTLTESNLIKYVKEKYNLTYEDMEEITGSKSSTIKVKASTGNIPSSIQKPLELYIRFKKKEEELEAIDTVKTALKTLFEDKK